MPKQHLPSAAADPRGVTPMFPTHPCTRPCRFWTRSSPSTLPEPDHQQTAAHQLDECYDNDIPVEYMGSDLFYDEPIDIFVPDMRWLDDLSLNLDDDEKEYLLYVLQ
mmetsp:Transcript_18802/g.54161  ORF Transcript_18802/g.54161 Transcript_18802/m.54161 type:complete len:107 (+) Transcript_18802:1157-1477(+)